MIIDAGSDGSDPANAVPFSIKTEDGRTFEQPGNFNSLIETALFGTEPKWAAKEVEPDLDGDGRVEFGEALPDAQFYAATTRDFERTAQELDAPARRYQPTLQDAMTALVVMAPTMSSTSRRGSRPTRSSEFGPERRLKAVDQGLALDQNLADSAATLGDSASKATVVTNSAIVGLVAIAVLLLITNWFFHRVYWSEWIGKFHRQLDRAAKRSAPEPVSSAPLAAAADAVPPAVEAPEGRQPVGGGARARRR